jgi:hypothetical protein
MSVRIHSTERVAGVLGVIQLVLIRSSNLAYRNHGSRLQRENYEVTFMNPFEKCPKLTSKVENSVLLVVRICFSQDFS